jgi:SAM-dependent methyltransferase
MLFRIKELADAWATPLYWAQGRRPWSPGYYTARKRAISRSIDKGLVRSGAALPPGYGEKIDERVVEYPWVFSQLPQIPGKMLDAGSALNHRFLVDRLPLDRAQLTVMTLAPEKRCFWRHAVSYVFGDLRHTDFADGVFDVVVSVSTIEHIGLDNTLLYTGDSSKNESDVLGFIPAVREFRRMLKSGGLCLITVPFGRRGVHGWYQVFDEELVSHIVDAFGPTHCTADYFGYAAGGWSRVQAKEIADAPFYDVHEGKPPGPDGAAGARGVACLRLVA